MSVWVAIAGLTFTVLVAVVGLVYKIGQGSRDIRANRDDLLALRKKLNGNLENITEELKVGAGELGGLREGVDTLKGQMSSIEAWCRSISK